MAILLPVMGILASTTEWSQRTNIATFTHLIVAGALWLGLPLLVGIRRIQRSEIK